MTSEEQSNMENRLASAKLIEGSIGKWREVLTGLTNTNRMALNVQRAIDLHFDQEAIGNAMRDLAERRISELEAEYAAV